MSVSGWSVCTHLPATRLLVVPSVCTQAGLVVYTSGGYLSLSWSLCSVSVFMWAFAVLDTTLIMFKGGALRVFGFKQLQRWPILGVCLISLRAAS